MPFITGHLRGSSRRQFHSVWQAWLPFCHRERPVLIDRVSCLSYLRYLFEERGLMPKSLQTYQSCLSDLLSVSFGVFFPDHVFTECKVMTLMCPAARTTVLSWYLDKVLEYIAPGDSETCPIRELLKITIFLIKLTSKGRVSEIHALRRGSSFLIRGGIRNLDSLPRS